MCFNYISLSLKVLKYINLFKSSQSLQNRSVTKKYSKLILAKKEKTIYFFQITSLFTQFYLFSQFGYKNKN